MTPIAAAASTAAEVPSHLDPVQLFLQADIVVQVVMAGLILASIWTWMIIVSFSMRMGSVRSRSRAFEQDFWDAEKPDALLQGRRAQDNASARVALAGINARGGRPGHFRGAVRDGYRAVRGDSGGDRVQPLQPPG